MIDGQQAAGIEVLSVGQATVAESQNTIAEEDLAKGEGIGVLAAMVVLADRLRRFGGGRDSDGARDLRDHRRLRPDRGAEPGDGPLVLHHQHDHDDRPRGRRRLCALRRRALPGGAAQRRLEVPRDRDRRRHGQQGRGLLRDDGHLRAERDVPAAEHDLPLARPRRNAGRRDRDGRRADADPGVAEPARRQGRLAAQAPRRDAPRAVDRARLLGPRDPGRDGAAAGERWR